MKIVYITNTIYRGGAEEYLLRLSRHFSKQNKLYIIIPHVDGTKLLITQLKELGVTCIDLKIYNQKLFSTFKVFFNKNLLNAHSIEKNNNLSIKDKILIKIKYLVDWVVSFYILKIINNIKPDIVHFNLHDVKRQYPSIYRVSRAFKSIVTLHLVPFNFTLENEQEQKKDLLKSLKNNTKYFAVSKTNAILFSRAISYNVGYIYNGIQLKNNMNYKNSKEIFIKKYNIPEDFTIFAIVGRIDYTQKDYLTVIKALKVLKNYTRKFRLIIVGNGLDMNRLKRDVQINDLEKEVIYTGFINNVENIYKSVDCLIFSTKYEGFALVILEAMSYNLNIIASDIDTTKEIIQDRYNGLLFTMGDSDNLSQLLIKNIYNLQNKLFIKGIKNTINNFTEEIMLKKVENEYNK